MADKEIIKLNKIINKGQFTVNFPALLVILSLIILQYILITLAGLPQFLVLIGVGVALYLGWYTWAKLITKWRIWAFSEIDEYYHIVLREEAIRNRLIWPSGHFLEKTEIRTDKEKELITRIDERIDELAMLEYQTQSEDDEQSEFSNENEEVILPNIKEEQQTQPIKARDERKDPPQSPFSYSGKPRD